MINIEQIVALLSIHQMLKYIERHRCSAMGYGLCEVMSLPTAMDLPAYRLVNPVA